MDSLPHPKTKVGFARSDPRWSGPLLFFAVSVILLLRQYHALQHPAFCAEDGDIFFKEQFEHGFIAALFTRYAGYFHLAPRIIAGFTSLFPLEQTPFLYALFSLLIASATLTCFYAPGFRSVINSDLLRGIVVVAFTLMPNADSLMRLAYLCWYLLFFLALITLLELPKRPLFLWLLLLPCVIAIWSAPLAIVCLPLFLYRAIFSRHLNERSWWSILGAATVVFALTIRPESGALGETLKQQWFWALIHALGYRVLCYFTLGLAAAKNIPAAGWKTITSLFLIFLGLFLVATKVVAERSLARQRFVPIALCYLILALPAMFVLRPGEITDFLEWHGDHTWMWHQRYFYASTLLLCVFVGLFYERVWAETFVDTPRAKVFVAAMLVGWLNLHALRFPLWDWQYRVTWNEYCRKIRAAGAQAINSGQPQTIHIATSVELFDFDLQIDRESASRNLRN